MLFKIWKKCYPLRMYNRQGVVKGYAAFPSFTDKLVYLDIQPVNNSQQNLAEGDRTVRSIRAYGEFPIQTADAGQYYRADRLFFDGEWFECTSAQYYEHTPIKHWVYDFTRVPESENEPPPTV